MTKPQPALPTSPDPQPLRDEIVHGTFVREGTLIAFPLCFPGASSPPPPDECRITALDVSADRMAYAGTSGRACHLVVGMFHGATGAVFDMGTVASATHCAALCCGTKAVVVFANGPDGPRTVRSRLQGLPFDLLQEWGFRRRPFEDVVSPDGERIVHAVATPDRARAFVSTDAGLFGLSLDEGPFERIGDVPARGRLAVGSAGGIFGPDDDATLWRCDPADGRIDRRAVALPPGRWDCAPAAWARDPVDGRLYVADDDGWLFAFGEADGFSGRLGRAPVAPVGPMAVTPDGRVFGWCGDGIGRLWCYDPAAADLRDLGCGVSVIQRRRYGYQFGAAAVGRDGQVFFGEDDDLGHLWLYFPSIRPAASR